MVEPLLPLAEPLEPVVVLFPPMLALLPVAFGTLPCMPPDDERVASTALGPVRTTVPVSLRGTALRFASAAVCGETPMPVGAWLVPEGEVFVV